MSKWFWNHLFVIYKNTNTFLNNYYLLNNLGIKRLIVTSRYMISVLKRQNS